MNPPLDVFEFGFLIALRQGSRRIGEFRHGCDFLTLVCDPRDLRSERRPTQARNVSQEKIAYGDGVGRRKCRHIAAR
jgi:hypothetical protein